MAQGDLTQILTEDKMDTVTVDFNDYEVSTAGMPDLTSALSNIKANSLFGVIFSNVKASLKRMKELADSKFDTANVLESLNVTTTGKAIGAKSAGEAINAINTNKQYFPNYSANASLTAISDATFSLSISTIPRLVYLSIYKTSVNAYYSSIKVNGNTIATVNAKDTSPIIIPITVSNGDILTVVHEQNSGITVGGYYVPLNKNS